MDIRNELEYQFGGAKGAREGTLQKGSSGKYEPNLIQKYVFGTTSEDLQRNAYQGELDRFGDTLLGQEAQRYGVDVTRADMGNIGGLRDRIDGAQSLRSDKQILKGLGYTGDLSNITESSALQPLIRSQKEANAAGVTRRAQDAAFFDPRAVDERTTRDQRYNNQMELTRAQIATGDKRYLLEMADRKDERAMDREDRRARERKEDLRYNENIERMDRKDRKQSIQTLVAGLANLGAAFAI